MSECTYHATVSLDGFLAGPRDSLAWLAALPRSTTRQRWGERARTTSGAVVLGGRTYRWLLAHGGIVDTAGWLASQGDRPHFVLTDSPLWLPTGAPVHPVSGEPSQWWPRVTRAAGPGGVGVFGGGRLAAQVAAAGLLDRVRLTVAPVVLGAGVAVLPVGLAMGLELQEVRDDGAFVLLDYRVTPGSRRPTRPPAPSEARGGASGTSGTSDEPPVPASDGLAEFLLARIAEDERVAAAATGPRWVPAVARDPSAASWTDVSAWLVTQDRPGPGPGPTVATTARTTDQQHLVRWDPARVLTECAVRRRLVRRCAQRDPTVLLELASAWADHPDHRSEWALLTERPDG